MASRIGIELYRVKARNNLRLQIGRETDPAKKAILKQQLHNLENPPQPPPAPPPRRIQGIARCLACGGEVVENPRGGFLCPNRFLTDHSQEQMRKVAVELDHLGYCNPSPPQQILLRAIQRARMK